MIARTNSTRTTATAGNPFRSHDVANLYPEPARPTEKAKSKRKNSVKQKFSLTAGTCVERRHYQIRAARKMLHLFTSQQSDASNSGSVGSILLQGSSESGKMITTLMVARRLQQKYGLTVAWASNSRRIAKLRRENSELGFDVNVQCIDLHDWNSIELETADLLILDQDSLDDVDTVDTLGDRIDPRIVIGLTSGYFLKDEIQECFDRKLQMTAKVRPRAVDQLPKQAKLPHMPVK